MNLGLDNWTMAILHGFHFDSWTRQAAGNPLHTDYPLDLERFLLSGLTWLGVCELALDSDWIADATCTCNALDGIPSGELLDIWRDDSVELLAEGSIEPNTDDTGGIVKWEHW